MPPGDRLTSRFSGLAVRNPVVERPAPPGPLQASVLPPHEAELALRPGSGGRVVRRPERSALRVAPARSRHVTVVGVQCSSCRIRQVSRLTADLRVRCQRPAHGKQAHQDRGRSAETCMGHGGFSRVMRGAIRTLPCRGCTAASACRTPAVGRLHLQAMAKAPHPLERSMRSDQHLHTSGRCLVRRTAFIRPGVHAARPRCRCGLASPARILACRAHVAYSRHAGTGRQCGDTLSTRIVEALHADGPRHGHARREPAA